MTMNVFPAIEGSSCYRYNNALHMSFHDHMHQVFAGYLEDYLKKLNLTQAIVDEYGKMWRSNKTSTERVPPRQQFSFPIEKYGKLNKNS